jgi:hypothetical protein
MTVSLSAAPFGDSNLGIQFAKKLMTLRDSFDISAGQREDIRGVVILSS